MNKSKKYEITRLRAYRPNGGYLEFLVGDEVTGCGKVESIEQINFPVSQSFKVLFTDGSYTFICGFSYTVYCEFR